MNQDENTFMYENESRTIAVEKWGCCAGKELSFRMLESLPGLESGSMNNFIDNASCVENPSQERWKSQEASNIYKSNNIKETVSPIL